MKSEREQAALLGRAGEDKAAEYYKKLGYFIIKRNWRDSRFGEIDLIAESEKDIVFVEVRTRKYGAIVTGAETVDAAKLYRVKNAAVTFMNRFNSDLPFRIDLIEATYYNNPEDNPSGKQWDLKQIENI